MRITLKVNFIEMGFWIAVMLIAWQITGKPFWAVFLVVLAISFVINIVRRVLR